MGEGAWRSREAEQSGEVPRWERVVGWERVPRPLRLCCRLPRFLLGEVPGWERVPRPPRLPPGKAPGWEEAPRWAEVQAG